MMRSDRLFLLRHPLILRSLRQLSLGRQSFCTLPSSVILKF